MLTWPEIEWSEDAPFMLQEWDLLDQISLIETKERTLEWEVIWYVLDNHLN